MWVPTGTLALSYIFPPPRAMDGFLPARSLPCRSHVARFSAPLPLQTRRPMVLTQRGRGVAVLVDAQEYERMQERLELLEEIYKAEEQIASGEGISHEDARSRVLDKLEK